jgi:UDP-N-acetylglucosamine--N-acetylmuramyl-(pentapeptide) pyrophosphoryl-undecaprenol N-acetylglucosamine transferase
MNYICYVAGKSGGHIIPALTHAQQEVNKNSEAKIIFVSTTSILDRSLLENHPLIAQHIAIDLNNIPIKNVLAWPRFLMTLIRSFYQSFRVLRCYSPKKVVSMGGYISIPVCCAAWLLRIPIEVYELNVVPGKAVKLLSQFAQTTHICFEQTRKYLPTKANCQQASYPLRFGEHHKLNHPEARKFFGISSEKKVLLVLGGSQGSRFINETMQKIVSGLQDKVFIIHQTGSTDVQWVQENYKKLGVESFVFTYRDDMHLCYSAADMVIARAGAGTLFELDFFCKKSFIIPLEIKSTDHQVDNAYAFAACNNNVTVVRQQVLMQNATLLQDWLRLSL